MKLTKGRIAARIVLSLMLLSALIICPFIAVFIGITGLGLGLMGLILYAFPGEDDPPGAWG